MLQSNSDVDDNGKDPMLLIGLEHAKTMVSSGMTGFNFDRPMKRQNESREVPVARPASPFSILSVNICGFQHSTAALTNDSGTVNPISKQGTTKQTNRASGKIKTCSRLSNNIQRNDVNSLDQTQHQIYHNDVFTSVVCFQNWNTLTSQASCQKKSLNYSEYEHDRTILNFR